MASKDCSQTAQVLLVGSQSLPVLLQSESEESANDISVDLLQQALQGAAAMEEDEGEGDPSGEVNSTNSNDVVAIYQGEEGNTHTIKISLAEAESLGLHFSNDTFPPSLENNAIQGTLKLNADENQLDSSDLTDDQSVSMSNFLDSMTCANIAPEGRVIDEDGNLIQATDGLQVLPSALSTLLEGGLNQSITIIPQYGLDGAITYAVKLKDQDGNMLAQDYHIMEPDSSAKTGLDIEEELTHSNLKQNILHASNAVSLSSTVALNHGTESESMSVPVTTLEPLSNHVLLPMSTTTVPMSIETPVTLSIPAENSISSSTTAVSSVINSSQSTPQPNRFFRIMPDRSTLNISNVITPGSTSFSLNSLVTQPTISLTQQSAGQFMSGKMSALSGASVMGIDTTSSLTAIPATKVASPQRPRAVPVNRHPPPNPAFSGVKKMPVSIATPATRIICSAPAPAMAAVAPSTTQPTIGGASTSKASSSSSSSRMSTSSSNLSKPLGSSENPIQLVQQGQTFHSMQALSQAQLRQIATVLQQKHLNSNSATTKNVLFDEQTKTRIVYRVVYPEDVDLQQPSSPTEKHANGVGENSRSTVNKSKGRRGRRKEPSERAGQRSNALVNRNPIASDSKKHSVDDDQTSENVMKAERKKVLASRTRSGRVSRPPKHMMKDYKRLHHLDYHEPDVDDSDGGYSDYNSAEPLPDAPSEKEREPEPEIHSSTIGGTTGRKKISRFNCPTCHKLYLGHGRMEKHFNRFPDHGSIEEFKQSLSLSTPTDITEDTGNDKKVPSGKYNGGRGKRRGQWAQRSEKERSESRKKKLKQALKVCEISEIMEVAGPLIAQYYSLWDLLLLRLFAKDMSDDHREVDENVGPISSELSAKSEKMEGEVGNISEKEDSLISMEPRPNTTQSQRAKCNRVQWLLMELGSLADTLQSIAGDFLQPAHIHENQSDTIEIREKTISEILGVSCGIYRVNEQPLFKRIEDLTAGKTESSDDYLMVSVAKRMCIKEERLSSSVTGRGDIISDCSEVMPDLSLMTKPQIDSDADKTMLEKLTEEIPFLNSSDDMICDGDDSSVKQDQDCDPSAGIQVVDDIVNERLKNLSENLNFSVQLQNELGTSGMSGDRSGLHLISVFDSAESSISVRNQSVISSSLADTSKPSDSVSNIDLINTYSMSSLSPTVPNIPNPVPPSDLANALEPVTSQGMLGSFTLGLSNLGPYDSLQSQSSPIANVSHSTDSFLDSLSSFETPLTQSCNSSDAQVSSYNDSVMKDDSILQLNTETSEPVRPPPKFISSFTPAITSDKQSVPITTAQRLQRSYLELDTGLDVGLDSDLDFEAFTEEFNSNTPNETM